MQQTKETIKERDVAALLRDASVELPPRADPAELVGKFRSGTDVYIAFLPSDETSRIVRVAKAIRRAGYNPVPHIACHEFAGAAALEDFASRLCGEAAVTRALVIAGDSSVVRGPFPTSLSLLQSGVLLRNGIASIDVGGHPEGNAHFTRDAGLDILGAKLAFARREGFELGVTTQFCFGAAPILDWAAELRKRRLDMPVRIGLAGPASLPTLMKFALRCGIGNSLRALRPNIGRFGRLLTDSGPDEVVDGIGRAPERLAGVRVLGFHFFAFGGLKKTGNWIGDRLEGRQTELAARA